MNPNEMMSVEEALDCVLSHVAPLDVETVSLLDAVGRVVAGDLISDCDITPFDHAARMVLRFVRPIWRTHLKTRLFPCRWWVKFLPGLSSTAKLASAKLRAL